ncbi:helix-turn-helix transcriptional regulator [Bacillus sp. FSL K6-0273]|uniref:helix-turn-helix domain-containing protein n=1 Tax=Bacillus TaxID=1386 RepID=UPI000BFC21EF|nr:MULTISPECIES: helix-turn-helix transcriptional regulator [Bacillus cereus group]KAB2364241.1 helix-turn-helix transcriptional regulator [Bacillus thuringiensis]MDF9468759.1 helix-turn-helix transcriptional regulator [Bacillus cereus]PGW73720.1 transcriptional regulator [Bacillus thuringiensis]HDR8144146.1 helix-turn-helix transcriptional regulator [Bacillus cereus]
MPKIPNESSTILRTVREAKGLTVQDVSRLSNVPENTLYGIEVGKSGVNANRAEAISLCLQEPLENLFEPSIFSAKKIE